MKGQIHKWISQFGRKFGSLSEKSTQMHTSGDVTTEKKVEQVSQNPERGM